MESHPSYPTLSPLMAKYPRASSSLFQAYNDIVYAQQWDDVDVVDLESCSRGAIKGKKRDTQEILYVVPCSLSETLNFACGTSEVTSPYLYIAITSQDASIVYYKLSQGIVKPTV
ncbi:hypothetical protein GALMADRAFT_88728 [Galerina marginata CBS 339.88]|uniref:tRNA-splicing endonuclease subunit Sen15 domain-containing protein n=1 Tax=Galerina marginata (strain CBS 339.88) TaxID=685588 RepID=A0A067TVE2_GALM3|nr:hypothetical protein GALMADRAFT_88728 [Galerina marginata CBS 339.88]